MSDPKFTAAAPVVPTPFTTYTVGLSPPSPESQIESLQAANGLLASKNAKLRDALQGLVTLKEWMVRAGGTEGPVPQDVIQKFAEMHIPAMDAAYAALDH